MASEEAVIAVLRHVLSRHLTARVLRTVGLVDDHDDYAGIG
jgi:hypothetical protein